MKKLIAVLVCLAALNARAVDEAVITDEDHWKMYTRPEVTFSEIDDDLAALAGLGIGTILNDQWTWGIAGHILLNDIGEGENDTAIDSWDLWYVGGEMGYIFEPMSLLHLNANLFLGAGDIDAHSPFDDDDEDGFFVMEPKLAACINLHETWEFGVGIGYRWVDGVDIVGLDDNDVSGITGSIFFRATEF